MRLSTRSEYACLALIDLAEGAGEGFIHVEDIARRKVIPKKYLEQILLTLKHARYVASRRGASGGFRLTKEPARVSVAEIIRLMDGALAPVESASKYFYGSTPIERSPKLLHILKDIRDYVADKLENTSIADLVEQ